MSKSTAFAAKLIRQSITVSQVLLDVALCTVIEFRYPKYLFADIEEIDYIRCKKYIT